MTDIRKQIIGYISVDAGLCWVGDPCYVLPDDASGRGEVNDWSLFCAKMSGEEYLEFSHPSGADGLGVCFHTGYGDGFYPVEATIIDDGDLGQRIASVTIKFIEEDDDE